MRKGKIIKRSGLGVLPRDWPPFLECSLASHYSQGSASARVGCVTVTGTARTCRTRRAVRHLSVSPPGSPVPMTAPPACPQRASVTGRRIVPTIQMRDPSVVSGLLEGRHHTQ